MQQAWLCMAFGDDRAYAGNIGYNDNISKYYQFDNFVPNHKRINEGDLIILRDRSSFLGVALAKRIESSPATKEMRRCPSCKTTGIKFRKTKVPHYRCNKGHEFDSPINENIECTKYIIHFEDSFFTPKTNVSVEALRDACPRPADQLSIQEIDVIKLKDIFNLDHLANGHFGKLYSNKSVAKSTRERKPFEVDPDSIDRATSTHCELQNNLATWAKSHGLDPIEPNSDDPPFDIAWICDDRIFLCEVKSLTVENEEKQLRYGLGQLLRYIHTLEARKFNVSGVLMVEYQPKDPEWMSLCSQLNVKVLWPEILDTVSPKSF